MLGRRRWRSANYYLRRIVWCIVYYYPPPPLFSSRHRPMPHRLSHRPLTVSPPTWFRGSSKPLSASSAIQLAFLITVCVGAVLVMFVGPRPRDRVRGRSTSASALLLGWRRTKCCSSRRWWWWWCRGCRADSQGGRVPSCTSSTSLSASSATTPAFPWKTPESAKHSSAHNSVPLILVNVVPVRVGVVLVRVVPPLPCPRYRSRMC